MSRLNLNRMPLALVILAVCWNSFVNAAAKRRIYDGNTPMMKKFLAVTCLLLPVCGYAAPISFTLIGDPTDFPVYDRSYLPGDVSGVLYGLNDDGLNQFPTSIEITSDVSALGITDNVIDSYIFAGGTGFDTAEGMITYANFYVNFSDPTVGGMQIRFNYEDGNFSFGSPGYANVLMWSGGTGPIAGMGNTDGMAGFVSPSEVPLPAAVWLFGSALLGLGAAKRSKA